MRQATKAGAGVTRRSFLGGMSAAGAALAVSGPMRRAAAFAMPQSAAQINAQAPIVDKGFACVRKVSDGVYAVVSDTSKGFDTLCNGGFVVGKDAALLWEGYGSPKGSAFQLETLASVSKAPVKAAINSHFHFDHTLGNSTYAVQRIPIWAHEKVVPEIEERYVPLQNRSKADFFAPAETHLRDAVSEDDKKHAEGDIAALKLLAGMLDSNVIALPNRPLLVSELPMKVDLGGIEVVIEAHPGHTPGDLILRIPAQNIVFAGDLIFNHSYPVTFDGDMASWMKALELFGSYGPKTVFVPGHGQICGVEGVELQQSVFGDLAEHARQMAQLGVGLKEAQARYAVPERYKDLNMFAWGFCVDQAVKQFYEAAKAGKI